MVSIGYLLRTCNTICVLVWLALGCFSSPASASQSIARQWDEQTLSAIRRDTPNPPVHARNLFHISVAMYDAWAAYDNVAVGYLYHSKQTAADISAARNQAISFAAYRMLVERYSIAKNASTSLAAFAAQMASLGYDTNFTSIDPSTPAGLGNLVAKTVSTYYSTDGSRQANLYQDLPANQGGYVPVNPPMTTGLTGTILNDVNHWQPLAITNALDQNGNPVGPIQSFLGSFWIGVRPFAQTRTNSTLPWMNPGPQPKLSGVGDAQFRTEVLEVITKSSQLNPYDGVVIDISPGVFGNNSLGSNDGHGHPLNPVTGQPYASNPVLRGDFGRVLAEFWADGPNSETPPGHWNVIANSVADNTNFVKRIGGVGPVVPDLEWDVKTYFAINSALHDAACVAWSLKRVYDGGRPISYIRYMGELGQSTLQNDPSYDPQGLTLTNGLVEIVTPATAAAGQRHAGLQIGTVAIYTWPGQTTNSPTRAEGARWIFSANWFPYQKATFVTPSFPGYISGHSTFSRAAAEVLTAITGSPFFPGGLGTFTAPSNTFLSFEFGPSQNVQLQWGTYYDAADQAGISRLWGGIHVSADDLTGRRCGSQCGLAAWALVSQYFDGSIATNPTYVSLKRAGTNQYSLGFNMLRGFSYKLQSGTNLSTGFTDLLTTNQVTDTAYATTVSNQPSARFFRAVKVVSP